VRLKTTGGKVIVDHVTGQADVSRNGDIQIRQVDGGAVVKNIGGDSWVGEVAGDLRANSANGGITVDVARAAVHAKTANGDIRVGELGSGTVDLYTATGELEVGVPQGTAAWLDARSSTGRVHNYLEAPDAPEQSTGPSRSAPAATAVTSSSTAPDPDAAPTAPTSPHPARETASALA
jgi:DUF4097 and DUF4098 domain-containing protein YvlB